MLALSEQFAALFNGEQCGMLARRPSGRHRAHENRGRVLRAMLAGDPIAEDARDPLANALARHQPSAALHLLEDLQHHGRVDHGEQLLAQDREHVSLEAGQHVGRMHCRPALGLVYMPSTDQLGKGRDFLGRRFHADRRGAGAQALFRRIARGARLGERHDGELAQRH
jgi:hypothetical protein